MKKVNPVVQEMINKTLQELNQSIKPIQKSRVSNTPNGYVHLIAWSNANLLRVFVKVFTRSIPKSEYRLKAQIDDAARSVIANTEEGYSRPTTSEYLTFLGYSQASLAEVKGDVRRSLQDGLLISNSGSKLYDIGIDLSAWHNALKKSVISKPLNYEGIYGDLEDYRRNTKRHTINHPYKFLYNPVDNINSKDLTYEVFIELINKTDWNLRKLVESLEIKLSNNQKYYQIEKLKLKSKLNTR